MDIKVIKQLADLMKKENLKTLEISEKDSRVFLVKHDGGVREVRSVEASSEVSSGKKKGVEVKSPLVGVYYSAPAPDAKPYVTQGKRVKKGDVLCVIEAMKQMNEIEAGVDGEIAEIFIKNGEIAEYDQPLFRIV